MIPGLTDNHNHVIRGGLNYNMELRWDGVPSLADAMRKLKEQVARTPAPQWVRVVGGFTEHQFAERRLPTLDEINAVAPETPVFILHLYDRALLNAAALRAVGYTKDTPDPPGGRIARDGNGNPTGLLIASPNAGILYATLGLGPELSFDAQLNSTRHFMRELNRLGVTSVIDAGGGSQNYPDDYGVIQKPARRRPADAALRLQPVHPTPGQERDDFRGWTAVTAHGQGDDFLRLNGAGEMLVFSAADFEDFREPRPDMPVTMEDQLEGVIRLLAENRWPLRLHATYDETISRASTSSRRCTATSPFDGLNWFFDHAETISQRTIERIAALEGGIAVQHRMAYQGEYFIAALRSRGGGAHAADASDPRRRCESLRGDRCDTGGLYDPWVGLSWLVTGRTVGGLRLYPEANLLDRETRPSDVDRVSELVLQRARATRGGSRSANSPTSRCCLRTTSRSTRRRSGTSSPCSPWLTVSRSTARRNSPRLAPPPPPVMPDWSPVEVYGGYDNSVISDISGRHTGSGGVGCLC